MIVDRNLTWNTAPETLKVSEAAQLAGLHINTIRSVIHSGHLQALAHPKGRFVSFCRQTSATFR